MMVEVVCIVVCGGGGLYCCLWWRWLRWGVGGWLGWGGGGGWGVVVAVVGVWWWRWLGCGGGGWLGCGNGGEQRLSYRNGGFSSEGSVVTVTTFELSETFVLQTLPLCTGGSEGSQTFGVFILARD